MADKLETRFHRRALADGSRKTYRHAVKHVDGAETVEELAADLQAACQGRPVGTVCVRKATAMHYAAAYLGDQGGVGALKSLLDDDVKIKARHNALVSGLNRMQLAVLRNADMPADIRLCLDLMLGCGLRSEEARSLPWSAVRANGLHVTGKGDKDRVVPLSGGLRKRLAARHEDGAEFVFPGRFGGSLSESGLWNWIKKLRKRHEELADFHPHQLRHNYAEALLDAGWQLNEIQKLLGHTSIATTAIYAQASRTKLDTAADVVEAAFR
jgi:integrase